ncbi:MAG: aspartate dehydrogenase [Clostridiales bacterium]|jgi:hypothetical protein|nr:aspartate dehydrogenase [Clostridiales bacterium]
MKKPKKIEFDPNLQQPAIRRSICTGETTVGFIDLASGRFTDYKLVKNSSDIDEFKRLTGTDTLKTIY